MSEPVIRGYVAPDGVGSVQPLLAALRAHEAAHGIRLQLVRADHVFGADHLRLAAMLAGRAVSEARSRSTDLPTETVLYAAGERQLSKAIAKMGVEATTRPVAVVSWGAGAAEALDTWAQARGWQRNDDALAGDETVLDAFGITPQERAMLPRERWGDLVLERVALVDVAKV